MPRLRRLKIYDQVISADLWTQRSDKEATSDVAVQTSYQAGSVSVEDVSESAGPRGWYSDLAIIESMPDKVLRQAMLRYKTLATQCEQELARRVVEGRCVRATAQFDVRYGVHRFVPVEGPRRFNQRAKRRAAKAGQVQLTPEQMLSALQMLLTLKQKG